MTDTAHLPEKQAAGDFMSNTPRHAAPLPPHLVPLSTILENRTDALGRERILIGEVLKLLDDRSIWALLLLLALPMAIPIPAPGLSVPFGACMVLISAQLAVGRDHAWIPQRLARRSMDARAFAKVVRSVLPTLRRLEKIVRPRKRWLAGDWMRIPVGVVCLILALIITLPIPLGHVVPGTAISLFSLGMMERDGVTVWAGLATAIAGIVLVILASQGFYTGLNHWLHA
jgi:hypothetical protein